VQICKFQFELEEKDFVFVRDIQNPNEFLKRFAESFGSREMKSLVFGVSYPTGRIIIIIIIILFFFFLREGTQVPDGSLINRISATAVVIKVTISHCLTTNKPCNQVEHV